MPMNMYDFPPKEMEIVSTPLKEILQDVIQNTTVQDKLVIYRTHASVGDKVDYQDPFSLIKETIEIGDDCAAIPDGQGGHLLFASEGIVPSFLNADPWFAGYSAVLVNISDICAMGGLPMALTDVVWLKDQADGVEIWEGMKAASEAYGVPIVGGHTCYRSSERHLAVSILGKAKSLLSSYQAIPGDRLLMAVDLNGKYYDPYPFWNASTSALSSQLQTNMRLLHQIAEKGWSKSAKDISMGGIIGTLAMLMHTSQVGARLTMDDIPKPGHVGWGKWLISFPSFGYLLTAKQENVNEIKQLFHEQNIACEDIGEILSQKGLNVSWQEEELNVL